eukprot:TRINITY_DN136298_c0_g1_i1.p1 TRINITY_DN136298_c0_g1~~TRINITY_DN136298_c0_g1_i1.p1  ORF type:complete len:199 (-),score=33.66 TRINITY_DN136298_c0_g1_i1:88-684(-)
MSAMEVDSIEQIEKEFFELKEKYFNEQIEALKQDYEQVKIGTNEQFQNEITNIDKQRDEKIWRAKQWREYQLSSINHFFEAEKQQAQDEYENDKKQLKYKMLQSISDKISEIEEEKKLMNITDDENKEAPNRQLRSRKKEKEKEVNYNPRVKKLNPSHINFTLQDSEIYEDLNYMHKYYPGSPSFDPQRWFNLAPVNI